MLRHLLGRRLPAYRFRALHPSVLLLTVAVAASALTAQASAGKRGAARFPDSELFSPRDYRALIRINREEWLLPPAQRLRLRSKPEDAGMRSDFGLWLKALLAPRWIPPSFAAQAPYLKVGTGRESRAFSCFFGIYRAGEDQFMVKGYASRVIVTVHPSKPALGPGAAPLLVQARAYQAENQAGRLGALMQLKRVPPALRSDLRKVMDRYLNPPLLPEASAWNDAPVYAYNRGFQVTWTTDGYRGSLPAGAARGHTEPAVCTVWTNGAMVRLVLEMPFWITPKPNLLASIPGPVAPSVSPLNPKVVTYRDLREWYDSSGAPVSDRARAAYTRVSVLLKGPYAPCQGVEGDLAETCGQPFLENQVRLPMTALKWHVVEFVNLIDTVEPAAFPLGAKEPEALSDVLLGASDRNAALAEARVRRDALKATAERFARLHYPQEVGPERNSLLAAMKAGAAAWDKAIGYWEPLVSRSGKESAAYYGEHGAKLRDQMTEAHLTDTTERITQATGVGGPLLRRFGLEE